MAISEDDIIRDTNERSNLQRAIADLETAIAVSNPGTRRILEASLEGVKARVSTLDKKINDAVHEREIETQLQAVAVAALAQKESALSESEKQTYSGFLANEFFTKKDFGKLEEFYTHSYDRLSEGGKDEMSKRFWKGVERGEYEFRDAPSIMQQKEAQRAGNNLGVKELDAERFSKMPDDEQRAFAAAYESADRARANQILTRGSKTIGAEKVEETKAARTPADTSSAVAEIDVSSIDLKNVQLVDATAVTNVSIPDASGGRVKTR